MKGATMKRVHIGTHTHDYMIIPSIGILDLDGFFREKQQYRFRIAFAWWNWRISIDIGKKRW